MRRVLGAALAALLASLMLTVGAVAADKGGPLPKIAAPAQAQESARDWNRSGLYGILLAGYDLAVLEAEGVDLGNGKLTGGAAIGFQGRMGDLVLRIEADAMLQNLTAEHDVNGLTVRASSEYLMSVRGGVGLPMGPALLYATGGAAFKWSKLDVNGVANSEILTGVVLGGGMELEVSRTLFVRIEALHYMFPDAKVDFGPGILETENQHTVVRAGIGFKLN